MTGKYTPIVEELQRAEANLIELWGLLGSGNARVALQRPGSPRPDDATQAYADGLRSAADALLKAIVIVRNLSLTNAH